MSWRLWLCAVLLYGSVLWRGGDCRNGQLACRAAAAARMHALSNLVVSVSVSQRSFTLPSLALPSLPWSPVCGLGVWFGAWCVWTCCPGRLVSTLLVAWWRYGSSVVASVLSLPWGGVGFACLFLLGGLVSVFTFTRRRAGASLSHRRSCLPCRWAGHSRVCRPTTGWRCRWRACLRSPHACARGGGSYPSSTSAPSSCLPRRVCSREQAPVFTNACLRGGGRNDSELLKQLQVLLENFSDHSPIEDSEPKPTKGKGLVPGKGSKGKGKGKDAGPNKGKTHAQQTFYDKPVRNQQGKEPLNSDKALLEALKRVVQRASSPNSQDAKGGLLPRLKDLIQAAAQGRSLLSKQDRRKLKRKPQRAEASDGKVPKGKGHHPEPGKGPGKGKGKGSAHRSTVGAKFQPARLHPKGWPQGAAMSVEKLRASLANGQIPDGCVTWATQTQVQELQLLAKSQNITKAYAVVTLVQPGQVQSPFPGGQRRKLPATDTHGRLRHSNDARAFEQTAGGTLVHEGVDELKRELCNCLTRAIHMESAVEETLAPGRLGAHALYFSGSEPQVQSN
eukprot:Skav222711  [mRNA]  locus=scaffold1661:190619:200766:- [translate_table: standard]